jgi:hypothetical protein
VLNLVPLARSRREVANTNFQTSVNRDFTPKLNALKKCGNLKFLDI